MGAWNPQESGRKAPFSCNAAFSMLQCSFSFVAAQLLVKTTSALQKSESCSAAQHSKICSATFSQGQMLAVWILAAKLPNSDLNLAVDFLGDSFPPIFIKERDPKRSTKKSPAKFTQKFARKKSPLHAQYDWTTGVPDN